MDTNKIFSRAKSILLTPRTEWPVIAAEPDTVGGLYSGYIVVMAAIPAVVSFLSSSLIGVSVPFLGTFRVGLTTGLTTAVVGYVLTLVGTYELLPIHVYALKPRPIKLIVGEPISTVGMTGRDAEALTERLRGIIHETYVAAHG